MNKLVFATNNRHKLAEIREILSDKFEILGLKDIGFEEDIPETANTLEGNARIKAELIYKKFGFDCFADDTGLEINALDGRPGVYSARYGGPEQDAKKNIQKILGELDGIANRNAQFRTVISLFLGGTEYQFEGIVKGNITENESGQKGFGYDPVFVPDGYKITFAEMESAEKNKISHRGKAVQKLASFLETRD